MDSSRPYLTPWFESPFFDAELKMRSQISESDQRIALDLNRDGLATIPGAIAPDMADQIVAETKPLLDGERGAGGRVQDAWRDCPSVRALATDPNILAILRTLYDRQPVPFQTLNFKYGTQQRPHSDTLHFNSIPARFMCGVWVALEDVGPDNGPLVYYPGSHRLPDLLPHQMGRTSKSFSYAEYEDMQEALMAAYGLSPSEAHVRRGDAVIWAANLVHGGTAIRAQGSTRWSQVTHYFFQDCLFWTPMHSDAELGNLAIRFGQVDIISGRPARQSYNGKRVSATRMLGWRSKMLLRRFRP